MIPFSIFVGATPDESPLPPIAPIPSEAGLLSVSVECSPRLQAIETAATPSFTDSGVVANNSRPEDKNEPYEQRDHRSECDQIFHAGAF